MTTRTLRPANLLLPAILAGLVGVAAAQNPAPASTPKKDPDPEVAAKIEQLKDAAFDKKFERDKEAVEAINFLWKKNDEGLCDKDKKAVVKVLDDVLNKGSKLRGPKQIEVYTAASAALAFHGEEGAKALLKAYDRKHFPDKTEWVPLRERLLTDIGKTKDEGMVKFLLEQARRNPEAALQAAAGAALANFEESKEALRKEIVEGLMIQYGSLSEKASQIGTNIEAMNAQDRLNTLQGKWNDTLRRLTKQNFDTFREWQDWHQNNKNKPW